MTVCTHQSQPLLVKARYGRFAYEAMITAARKTTTSLWCGVVMPDHVHLLVTAKQGKSPLDMAACFKRLTTIAVRKRGYNETLWQRRIHDRGLRNDWNNDLAAAVRYVLDNPVQQGLVDTWSDWSLSYLNSGIDL